MSAARENGPFLIPLCEEIPAWAGFVNAIDTNSSVLKMMLKSLVWPFFQCVATRRLVHIPDSSYQVLKMGLEPR
jgi:hypothetical protein